MKAAKDLAQAEFFRNRLLKNEKHLRKWARRESIYALRLYDRDIPEIPLAVDLFRDTHALDDAGDRGDCLLVALYQRPYDKDPALEEAWLELMAITAAECLGVDASRCFSRTRSRQRGMDQYERLASGRAERIVLEAGLSFIVNLSDYLDTGLFLDHRPTRALVRTLSRNRRILNLFSYTGSFSVHAAAGGASEACSVDLSNTYLSWADRNLRLNGFQGEAYPLVKAEARNFLEASRQKGRLWDLVIADPPTFSNSKASSIDFDVNRDWPTLIKACLAVTAPGGTLLFSTNSRRIKWDGTLVDGHWEDISEDCLPPDFRNRKIRRTWRIDRS